MKQPALKDQLSGPPMRLTDVIAENFIHDVQAMVSDALQRGEGDKLVALCILDAEWMGHDPVRSDAKQLLRLALSAEQFAIWLVYSAQSDELASMTRAVELQHAWPAQPEYLDFWRAVA